MGNEPGGDNWTPTVPGDYRLDHDGSPDVDTAREHTHELQIQLRAALADDAAGYRVTDYLTRCGKLASDILAALRTGDE